jgi:carbon storage regulator
MLVLSRKVGDAIMLGSDIEIKVLEVNGAEVKLGIEAPKKVSIFRKEIFEEIKRQNKSASKGSIPANLKEILKPIQQGKKKK